MHCWFRGGDRHLLDVILTSIRDLRPFLQNSYKPCDCTENPDNELEMEVAFEKSFLKANRHMQVKWTSTELLLTASFCVRVAGIYI